MAGMRFTHHGWLTLGPLPGKQMLLQSGLLFENPQTTGESPALANVPPGVWLPFLTPGKIIGLWTDFRATSAKNG